MDLSSLSYHKFVNFAMEEARLCTTLTPLPYQVPALPLFLLDKLMCNVYFSSCQELLMLNKHS